MVYECRTCGAAEVWANHGNHVKMWLQAPLRDHWSHWQGDVGWLIWDWFDNVNSGQFIHTTQTTSGRRKEGGVTANPVAFIWCILLPQLPVVVSKGHVARRWGGDRGLDMSLLRNSRAVHPRPCTMYYHAHPVFPSIFLGWEWSFYWILIVGIPRTPWQELLYSPWQPLESLLSYNTHRSAPPVSALAHSRGSFFLWE